MLRISSISRKWGEFSLRNINLEIEEEEYFVILGPTGSGKTLLLEVMAGFYKPDEGKMEFRDRDFTDLPPNERNFGFVYQDYMLFPHMKVRDNIAYGLKVRKAEDIEERVEEMARAVGVDHLMDRSPLTLSGGEQQRVAMARALVLKPDVLLLDEPYGGLDRQTTVALRSMVKDLHRKYGGIVVHVTHDQEEAVVLGDRVAVMKEGGIEQVGSPGDVMRRPSSKFVAEFVGTGNVFRETAKRKGDVSMVTVEGVDIYSASTLEGEVTLTIRPEDIILANQAVESSARNNYRGKVTSILDRGIFHEVTVDIGIPMVVFITRQSIENLGLEVNKEVYLLFKASSVHMFMDGV
jgi:molybdopterin-binding protein